MSEIGDPMMDMDMAENKGPMIITVCWVFTALSVLFVAARLHVRAVVHRKLFSDDYWILVSIVCAVISNIMVTMSVIWGNGQHFAALSLEQKQNSILWMMAAYVPGIETLGLPKLAVVALLCRLLAPSKLHRWILWFMAVLCCLSVTAMGLALILQCSPPRALWDFSLPHNCLHPDTLKGLAFFSAALSGFLDFYLAIYPAVVLWQLQLPVKKKMALSCALGAGFASGAVAIVKATGVPALSSPDVTWDLSDPLYWTSIEGNLVIIAACIPILQPLIEMIKGRRIWTSKKSTSDGNYAKYGKRSTNEPDPMELRSKPRKKVDVHGFTILDHDESEESIVARDAPIGYTSSGRRSGTYCPAEGGIMKTNAITVTYEQGPGTEDQASGTKRWAAL